MEPSLDINVIPPSIDDVIPTETTLPPSPPKQPTHTYPYMYYYQFGQKGRCKEQVAIYSTWLTDKYEREMPQIKKAKATAKSPHKKEDTVSFTPDMLPNRNNYVEVLLHHKHSAGQLKQFARHHKIKITGNKEQLLRRLYAYLFLSSFAVNIQKIARGYFVRRYWALRGPAYRNRQLCTNQEDFVSLELVADINPNQFISYQDEDGFIYGFDIKSLHHYYIKLENFHLFSNPYTRKKFPAKMYDNMRSLFRLGKLLHIDIDIRHKNDTVPLSDKQKMELYAVTVFQAINHLGNYADVQWFLSLSWEKLLNFIGILMDVWNYRAHLDIHTKKSICPPNGTPFQRIRLQQYQRQHAYLSNEERKYSLQNDILQSMETLVKASPVKDNRALGAFYILGALTIVNIDAATAMPWLYESFIYQYID